MCFVESLEQRRMLSAVSLTFKHPGPGSHGPAQLAGSSHGHGQSGQHHGKPGPVAVHGRNLMIQGSKSDDTILVTADATDPTSLDVTFNGQMTVVPLGRIKRLMINAKGGNDTITIDNSVKLSALLIGGPGDDTMTAGGGTTVLVGGSGNNKMTGGSGADMFVTRDPTQVTNFDAAKDKIVSSESKAESEAASIPSGSTTDQGQTTQPPDTAP